MPSLFEIGLEPIEEESLVEVNGLEPVDDFDPVKEAVGNPTDTFHRFMGGLSTGALSSAQGVARWGKLVTDAQKTVLDKVGLGAPAGLMSKALGTTADVLEGMKQDVQSYSESKRNRERDPLFTAQLAEAGGNFAGQIATAAVGKVPAIISNVGQMFQQEYGAAKEQGADDLTAYQAGVSNLPAAFLDYFTESKMVKSLVPQQAKRTLSEVTKKIFTNAGLEGATEVVQDEYSNWLAGNALKYDQERAVENRFSKDNLPETGKQIAKTFAIGAILGGTATTAFEALQPAPVDEKGLAKEERLEILQKELDQINETQEKTQTDTAEFTPTVSTNIPEVEGNTPSTALSEVSRVSPEVRQLALDTEAEKSITEAEQVLNEPETVQDAVTPEQGTLSLEKEPISQPEAITGIPSESDLKKIDVLKKATDVLKEDWESAPQIEVVANVSAIPDNALTQAEKDALKGNVTPDGLFGKDGKVYIIGDKVPNIQRVKELVLHETKAHYGFKSLFGGDDVLYKRAMQTALDEFNARPKMADALASRRGGFKDLADLVKAYDHLNVEHKEGKYAITEELLSRASELYHDPAKPRPTWFNRIISRIKLALQPIMPGMKLNDQDIINLLGTKSTELLDAAGQKVETGKAEIPNLSQSQFSLAGSEDERDIVESYDRDDPDSWPLPNNLINQAKKLQSNIENNPSDQMSKDDLDFLQKKADKVISVLDARAPQAEAIPEVKTIYKSPEQVLEEFRKKPKEDQDRINEYRKIAGKKPLFSLSKLNILDKEIKTINGSRYYHIDDPRGWISVRIADHKNKTQDASRGDLGEQIARRKSSSGMTNPHEINIVLENPISTEKQAEDIISNILNEIPDKWLEKTEFPDKTIYGSSIFAKKTKNGWELQNEETGQKLTIPGETKFSLSNKKEPIGNINYERLNELGFTTNFREAGYLTTDGKLIDLSGKKEGGPHNTRSYDHREAGGSKGMLQFMNLGNIRLFPESGGMDLLKIPNSKQQDIIKKFIEFHNGKVVVDLGDGLGSENDYAYNDPPRKASLEFQEGTKPLKVLGAIKRFYSGEDLKSGTRFSLNKTPAPAVHIGDQEFEGQKFPFFNLTEDIPGHPKNSTVSTDTLIKEGFGPPEGYTGDFKESDFSKFSLSKEPVRKFSERQKENPHFDQIGMGDLVEKIDSNYQAVSNKEGAETAAKTLEEIGIAEAMDQIDSSTTISARDRQYLGIAAMEYWNNVAAKAETQEDLDIASRNMVHVIESLARRGTEYGQAIQAMRGRLTPEGWIRTTLNQFKEAQAPMRKAGKKVVEGIKKSVDYEKLADQIQTKTRVKNLIESFQKKVVSESKKTIKDTIFDTAKTKQLKVEVLAKNLVEESGLNGKQAEALSKAIISATHAEIGLQTKKYIEGLKKTNSADKKIVKAMKDDITKIMDYSILGVLDDETLYNHLAEKLNLPFYDQKFIQEVKADAERIKDDELLNKSPMLKNKAIYDLGNKIAKRSGTSNYDIGQAYWYASVLSGIRTQLKNLVGTAGQSQLNNFLLSADALRRGDKGEVMAIYSGWLGGLEKGIAAASDALLKGDFTGQYSFEAKKAASALEQISDSPDKWKRIISNAKYVSRFMAAADILNASANAESRARLKAYQMTKDVNLTNQDRQKAINEILHTTPDEIKEAQLQAEQEGFKPDSSTYRRRVNEILELQRPSDLNSEAREYGLLSTYNNEPNTNTLLGALAGFIEKGIAAGNKSESDVVKLSARAARFAIPFTRIVANVGNEQLNYTPVGLLRLATLNNFNKNIDQTKTDLTLLKSKVLLGNAMLMGLAAMLSQWDDEDDPPFQIVGSGPSDPSERSQWLAAGNKPWSIIWKDSKGQKHTATYTYTPFAMMLGVLGAYKDAQRYGNIDEKSAIIKVASAIANGLTVITDASFLSGVTSLMDVYAKRKDVESFSKGLVQQVARTAGGLAPNILKEFDSWFNKPLRDTKASDFELAAIFANQLPVIKDAVGKPMLNVLGEEIKNPKYPWQPFIESKEVDPIWNVLAKKQNDGVFISLPAAATKVLPDGKRQTMNNQELYEYRKEYGKQLKKTLTENMSFFEKADPEISKKLLEGWSAAARANAKIKLKFY